MIFSFFHDFRIFINFPWLSRKIYFSRIFNDFPWPWEPCCTVLFFFHPFLTGVSVYVSDFLFVEPSFLALNCPNGSFWVNQIFGRCDLRWRRRHVCLPKQSSTGGRGSKRGIWLLHFFKWCVSWIISIKRGVRLSNFLNLSICRICWHELVCVYSLASAKECYFKK